MQSGFVQAPRKGTILQLIPKPQVLYILQALCLFMNSTCFLTFNMCFVVGTGSLEVFTTLVVFFFKIAIVEKITTPPAPSTTS